MAIMPIWERAPLMTKERVPLSPGAVRARRPEPAALLMRLPSPIPAPCLEGAVRLAACGYENRAEDTVRGLMAVQDSEGAFPGEIGDALGTARAVWALYLWRRERDTMASVAAWLQWVADHYDAVITRPGMREQPADLMELALSFYWVTGKRGSLLLAARLRRDGFDWSTALRTFDLQRPIKLEEKNSLPQGTEEEQAAYLHRVQTLGHAVRLADGLRFAGLCAAYSGSGTSLDAPRKGWERISRWHGLPCGGIGADPMLQGRGADAVLDPEAVGAWAEALADSDANGDWPLDVLERLTVNALAAVSRQPETELTLNRRSAKTRQTGAAALGRLLRGWAAALSHAVCLRREGVELNRFEEGIYACAADGKPMLLQLERGAEPDVWRLTVQGGETAERELRVRVPFGVAMTAELDGKVWTPDGKNLTIRRSWRQGDAVTFRLTPCITIETGYHQSRAVFDGPVLMAAEAPAKGGYALESAARAADGGVCAAARAVEKQKGEDVPVLPETSAERLELPMRPFAEKPTGWAMFAAVKA